MKYNNRLKEIRLDKGLTLKQVADLMGKQCEDRISEWERGMCMPSIPNLLLLVEIYKVPLDEIYSSQIQKKGEIV